MMGCQLWKCIQHLMMGMSTVEVYPASDDGDVNCGSVSSI